MLTKTGGSYIEFRPKIVAFKDAYAHETQRNKTVAAKERRERKEKRIFEFSAFFCG
jgi:hypothetical protein